MARTRNIKPGFFKNDLLAEIEPLGRLLFAGLWTIADREGRLEDRPKRIKAEVLPYDNCDIDALLTILFDKEFITRYEISAQKYIQITNFNKHQNPHVNEPASGIPAPEKYSTSTVQVPEKYDTSIRVAQFKSCLVPSTNHLKPSTDHLEYICSSVDERRVDASNNETIKQPGESLTVQTAGTAAGKETRQQPSKTLAERRFDEFWAAYPKKVGKKDAQKAWRNAKVNTELFDKIMTAIGRARTTDQWQRENGRYIPNPSTWLNQGRWDDEIKEANTNGEHRSTAGANSKEPTGTKSWRAGSAAPGFKLAGEPDDPDGD